MWSGLWAENECGCLAGHDEERASGIWYGADPIAGLGADRLALLVRALGDASDKDATHHVVIDASLYLYFGPSPSYPAWRLSLRLYASHHLCPVIEMDPVVCRFCL